MHRRRKSQTSDRAHPEPTDQWPSDAVCLGPALSGRDSLSRHDPVGRRMPGRDNSSARQLSSTTPWHTSNASSSR